MTLEFLHKLVSFIQDPFVQSAIFYALLTIYFIIILGVSIQIIKDTTSPSKTMGYLLLIVFLPVFGVILYLSIGVNYRNRRMYNKKLDSDKEVEKLALKYFRYLKKEAIHSDNPSIKHFANLAYYIASDDLHGLSVYNKVTLLNNGEEKFPEVLKALEAAESTIHIEYYIVRNDNIGNQIKDILIRKAKEGVDVRFIYDALGAREIRKEYAQELRNAGVEIVPFRELTFISLANRLNYRNHRKIIVVDGKVGFVGGINMGDEYINTGEEGKKYWRDVHIRVEGYCCHSLQYIFLSDWNFCSGQALEPSPEFFPIIEPTSEKGQTAQIVASGPDSPEPMIMNSIIQAIGLSKKEVLITTPYFVPSEPMQIIMKIAALSQVKVKLLIPEKTDSILVAMSSESLFDSLLSAGVEIYLYERGFVHSKTLVFDRSVAMVGTANMDNRSFDLNFEVNAVIYDNEFAERMANDFFEDLKYARQVNLEEWRQRPTIKKFLEKLMYLTSSLL